MKKGNWFSPAHGCVVFLMPENSLSRDRRAGYWCSFARSITIRFLPCLTGSSNALELGEGDFYSSLSSTRRMDTNWERKSRLDTRKNSFSVGLVRPQDRLPRETVDATTQAVFKARLDNVLNNQSSGMCPCSCWSEDWDWMVFEVLSNPLRFYNSVIPCPWALTWELWNSVPHCRAWWHLLQWQIQEICHDME